MVFILLNQVSTRSIGPTILSLSLEQIVFLHISTIIVVGTYSPPDCDAKNESATRDMVADIARSPIRAAEIELENKLDWVPALILFWFL